MSFILISRVELGIILSRQVFLRVRMCKKKLGAEAEHTTADTYTTRITNHDVYIYHAYHTP